MLHIFNPRWPTIIIDMGDPVGNGFLVVWIAGAAGCRGRGRVEEKTDWRIVSGWPKRSDDDEDNGRRTKTKDYRRSQWNGIGGDKPE